MARALEVVAIVVASALCARAAVADGPRRSSSLSWTRLAGTESCIAPRDLAREVERRLGRSVFVSAALADVTVEGHVEARRPGFRATMRLLDASGRVLGTRELDSADASCSELGAQVSLVVALMIDPEAPPPPLPRAAAAPAGRDVAVQTPPVEVSPPYQMGIDAGPMVSTGLLPADIATGVGIRWTLDPEGWPAIQVAAAYWPPSRMGPNRLAWTLAYGGLAVCPLTLDSVVRVESCGGMALGRVATSTYREDVAAHGFLEARVYRRLFGPLRIGLGAGAGFPLNRQGWRVIGGYQPDVAFAAADLGIGIEVP